MIVGWHPFCDSSLTQTCSQWPVPLGSMLPTSIRPDDGRKTSVSRWWSQKWFGTFQQACYSWLVVYLPFWKIWKSDWIIIPAIYGKKQCSKTSKNIRTYSNKRFTMTCSVKSRQQQYTCCPSLDCKMRPCLYRFVLSSKLLWKGPITCARYTKHEQFPIDMENTSCWYNIVINQPPNNHKWVA